MTLSDLTLVILCGGLGTRLRSVISNAPKSMAPIGDRPLLDVLLDYYYHQGFRDFVLCTGYMRESIEDYYSAQARPYSISFSSEQTPLGTGGAVRSAIEAIRSDPFFVANGDTLVKCDFQGLLDAFESKDASAVIGLVHTSDVGAYGQVDVETSGEIGAFAEKGSRKGQGWVNGGVYVLSKRALHAGLPDVFSLERDLFPGLVGKGLCGFKMRSSIFVDIGTPAGYAEALSQSNIISTRLG